MPTVGVILSGCGVHDGTEIHEAVLTLLALDQNGADVVCMAPNTDQRRTFDHLAQEDRDETRNVLVESARISRGEISDIADVDTNALDAVILPGGFGAALNLSSFAVEGTEASIDENVARVLREMHAAGKPIGAVCISPAVIALALGDHAPTLTIGHDAGTAGALESLGASHEKCDVENCVVDETNRIVTSPAYMLGPSIKHVAVGIDRTVARVLEMCA